MLSEIEKLVTDVAIIDQGKILYEGKLKGLQDGNNSNELTIELDNVEAASTVIKNLNFTVSSINNNSIILAIQSREEIAKINKALVGNGIEVYQLKAEDENLESIFLNITNRLDQ